MQAADSWTTKLYRVSERFWEMRAGFGVWVYPHPGQRGVVRNVDRVTWRRPRRNSLKLR